MSVRRARWALVVAALMACGDASPDGSTPEPSRAGGEPEAATPPAAGPATPTPSPAAPPIAGELPDATAVPYQIFDETVEADPPRRVTLHMLVSTDATRDQLRRTLMDAIEAHTRSDSVAVAVRAVGYRPDQVGTTDVQMIPYAWAEWLPTDGWYAATDRSRNDLHRTYFYHEIAPQW